MEPSLAAKQCFCPLYNSAATISQRFPLFLNLCNPPAFPLKWALRRHYFQSFAFRSNHRPHATRAVLHHTSRNFACTSHATMDSSSANSDSAAEKLDKLSVTNETHDGSRKVSEHVASKRREKLPLKYTDDFETPSSHTLATIGVVRSPYKERFGTPRQPNVTENTLGNKMQRATIHLYKNTRFEHSLRGLAQFEYCWVVSFFHLNQGFNPLVTPPRGPRKKQGVFATRSPHRPNSIGLSCIRITGVEEDKGLIHLLGVDLLDGTSVLDIKPYVPYCDAFPNAKAGWLDALKEDMKAPDALGYYPPPAHLMRPVTFPSSSDMDQSDTQLAHENNPSSDDKTN